MITNNRMISDLRKDIRAMIQGDMKKHHIVEFLMTRGFNETDAKNLLTEVIEEY